MYNQIISISNSKKIFDLNVQVILDEQKVIVSPYHYSSEADWEEVNLYFAQGKSSKLHLGYFQSCQATVIEYWELLQESEQAFQDRVTTIPINNGRERKALRRDLPKAVRLAARKLKLDGSGSNTSINCI